MKYFLLLLLFIGSTSINQKFKVNTPLENLQPTVDRLVLDNEIPGINVSIITSDGKQHNFSSGYSNLSTMKLMNENDLMFSGSVGKTYASGLIFQLVESGKLALDDKVLDHLPNDLWLQRLAGIDQITIRMLLSHTSGLPRWVMKPEVWKELSDHPDKEWSYEDRLSYIFDEPSVHPPGEGWAYSDTNFILLGYVIEHIGQGYYYDILRKDILQPHALEATIGADHRKIDGLAMGYSELPETFHIPSEVVLSDGQFVFNPQMEWTGGGIVSTAIDLAKWTQVLWDSDFMSEALRKEVMQVNPNGNNVYHDVHSYGIGCFIYNLEAGTAYGHSGFMPGYNTICAYLPEKDMTIAIQINCDFATKKGTSMTQYLDEIIAGMG